MSVGKARTGCLVLFTFILFVIVMCRLLVGLIVSQSQVYFVEFKALPEELRRGDLVELAGESIGTVLFIRRSQAEGPTTVHIRVNARNRDKVRRDAVAVLRGGGFLDGSERRKLEIINPEGESAAPPLGAGGKLTGLEGELAYQLWKVRGSFQGVGGALAETASGLGLKVQDAGEAPTAGATSAPTAGGGIRRALEEGRKLFAQGEYESAREAFLKAAQLAEAERGSLSKSGLIEANYGLGECAFAAKEYNTAEHNYKDAVALDKNHPTARKGQARLAEIGRLRAATPGGKEKKP